MESYPTRGSASTTVEVAIDEPIYKSLSSAVVCIVASLNGKEIDAMPLIRERIHPEALDILLEPAIADPSVTDTEATFRYDGCQVTISSKGTIVVDRTMYGM